MANYSYPTVNVAEKDLTGRISLTGSTPFGAIAINSVWGPCENITLVTNETDLVGYFGKPNSNTYVDFFSALNFLSYSPSLYVVRVVDDEALNAVSGNNAVQIKNNEDFETATLSNSGEWIAKYPGAKGNSLLVAACDSTVNLSSNVISTSNTFGTWSDYFNTIPGTSTNADEMDGSLDELHLLVFDEDGSFTGTPKTLLEKYEYLSKATDAKKEDGTNNFYKDVINSTSRYIRTGDDYILNANSTALVSDIFTPYGNTYSSLSGGVDTLTSNTTMYINGYNLFSDKKDISISHIISGDSSPDVAKELITLAENRGDCIVYISPEYDAVQQGQTQAVIASNIVDYKQNSISTSSSYYFMDGNWKQQYDKYNDVYRWIPCNADVAGNKAKSESENDLWWNGSGYNRGLIRNCIKLAWNPKDEYMGTIYKASVNPIISEGGQFVILGDKTGLTKPSAFDRINVRSLFNVLKTKIGFYLKYSLFEFNDEFTREQVKSQIESYLRIVKGRRGIEDFYVKCDIENNPDIIRDDNTLVVDVFVKPTKTINWIDLNIVNTPSSVEFNEIVGKVSF